MICFLLASTRFPLLESLHTRSNWAARESQLTARLVLRACPIERAVSTTISVIIFNLLRMFPTPKATFRHAVQSACAGLILSHYKSAFRELVREVAKPH